MHPRVATLLAYHDGELNAIHTRWISRHLQRCAQCRLKSELDPWPIDRPARMNSNSTAGGDSARRRAEFQALLRSLRSSEARTTRPLLALLVGRKAALSADSQASAGGRLKPLTVTILAATAFHLLLGLVAFCAWQLTGNFKWVQGFFHSAGDLFLFELAAAALYLHLQVRKGFSADEPLHAGWTLISTASACGVAGSIFSKLLATHSNPLWPSVPPPDLLQFGLFLAGPMQMAVLACGLFSILRQYHRAGILTFRLIAADYWLLAAVGSYTLCETWQVALAINSGRLWSLRDFLQATNDPLLLLLLAAVMVLRRSVHNIGGKHVARSWSALIGAFGLISLGNMIGWGVSYGYLPLLVASVGWHIWFVAGASYALTGVFQLQAMGRTAGCVDSTKVCDVPAVPG